MTSRLPHNRLTSVELRPVASRSRFFLLTSSPFPCRFTCVWRLERGLGAPASMYSLDKADIRQAGSFRPRGNTHGLAIMREQDVAAPIPALFFSRRPTTVARFVVPVVVDPVQLVRGGWSRSHVGDEVGERLGPPLADLDAAPAVPCVGPHRWVGTSLDHHAPQAMFRVVAFAMRPQPVSPMAPARDSWAFGNQRASRHDLRRAAIAAAMPLNAFVFSPSRAGRHQFPEPNPGEIDRMLDRHVCSTESGHVENGRDAAQHPGHSLFQLMNDAT